MSYYEWLSRHRKRDSPLGDLARDVADDRQFPRDVATLDGLLCHLTHHRACWQAIETARASWATYRRYLRRLGGVA